MIDAITQLIFGHQPKSNRLLRETTALAGAIPLIAQALVERRGKKIRVLPQGDQGGSTDGTNIYLEATPIPQSNQDVDAFVLYTAAQLGLVHHEVGHVNHTDFTAPRSRDKFTRYLENVIEDVRQELLHIRLVPSARDALDALDMAVEHRSPMPAPSELGAEAALAGWIEYSLRSELRKQGMYRQPAIDAREATIVHIGQEAVDAIDTLLQRAAGLKSTTDAIALAKDIVGCLRKEGNKQASKASKQQQNNAAAPSQAPQQGQQASQTPAAQQGQGSTQDPDQQQAQSNQPDSSQQQGQGASQNQCHQQGQGASQDPAQQQGQGSSDPQGQLQGQGSTQSDTDTGAKIAQTISQLLQGKGLVGTGDKAQDASKVMAQIREQMVGNGASLIPHDAASIDAADRPISPSIGTDDPSLETAMSHVGRLRAVLNKHLQAISVAKTGRSTRGSQLAPRALERIPLGDPRLFRRHQQAERVDTAIVLALDVSGSMSGEKIHLANQAVYATACALETLPGCSVAALSFPGQQKLLDFGQRARKQRQVFGQHARGNTPMHEAILMSRKLLAQRTEPRKLLLVVTDGEPDSRPSTSMQLLAAQREGIEACAIGIHCDAVGALFEHWASIKDVAQLPKAIFEILGGRLLSTPAAA